MYRYRLFDTDGNPQGEAHYAVLIKPGETIWTGDGRHLRVVDAIPPREDSDIYLGLLMVEAA